MSRKLTQRDANGGKHPQLTGHPTLWAANPIRTTQERKDGMKRLALSAMLVAAMAMGAAAQSGGSAGTGSTSSGSTGSTSTGPDQSTASSPSSSQTGSMSTSASSDMKDHSGKKAKMTGCVQKEGSGYALVDKKHPNGVQLLTSEDLSAHVGHKVEVKGMWEAGSMSSASNTTASTSGTTSQDTSNPATPGTGSGASASGSTSSTPMSESHPGSTSGAGSSSNASSLPQSDQSTSGQAIRVTEVKMKSDKCDMTSGNNNPSKY
jgi:trimeric autotransporter adhesin